MSAKPSLIKSVLKRDLLISIEHAIGANISGKYLLLKLCWCVKLMQHLILATDIALYSLNILMVQKKMHFILIYH